MILKKINLFLIFGGKSFEHYISIKSVCNVLNNINRNYFNIVLIGIDKKGIFHINKLNKKIKSFKKYLFYILNLKNNIFKLNFNKNYNYIYKKLFIFFPLIHGDYGEDGNIQGLLNTLNIPYIGTNIDSSVLCINKYLTKNILKLNNFPIVNYLKININDITKISYNYIKTKIGKKFFIKPVDKGSSIGITFVNNKENFNKGISRAFYFSNTIIFESSILYKEIECSILDDNGKLIISDCVEIIKNNYYYTFEQKNNNKKNNVKIIIPANINLKTSKIIKKYSLKIYKIFSCKNFARISFFINKKNNIFVNEINTIPGLTKNSIYIKSFKNKKIDTNKLIMIILNTHINSLKKKIWNIYLQQ